MSEDSITRNLGWQVTSAEKQIAETYDKLQAYEKDAEVLPDLQREKEVLAQQITVMEGAEVQLAQELSDLEGQIFKAQIDLHERGGALERARMEYLQNAFPGIPEVTEIVFGKLFAGDNCIVCQSPSELGRTRLKRLFGEHRCPVCESPIRAHGNVLPAKKLSDTRLRELEKKLQEKEAFLSDTTAKKNGLEIEIRETRLKLFRALENQRNVEYRIERAIASSGDPGGEIAKARQFLATQKRELEVGKAALQTKRKQYEALLEKARRAIAAVADDVVATFGRYAKAFILEDCKLTYRMDPRTIGQGGVQMNFPSFQLEMTSAVLPVAKLRRDSAEVSESQKEFIDLAFRMALLKISSKERSGALLVIETPEASLDSIFVDRAGRMLHQFAHGRGNKGNQLIATSNLNKENMIPALLGLKDERGNIRRATSETDKRIINLLALAAPSRAYTDFKKEYDRAFREALGR